MDGKSNNTSRSFQTNEEAVEEDHHHYHHHHHHHHHPNRLIDGGTTARITWDNRASTVPTYTHSSKPITITKSDSSKPIPTDSNFHVGNPIGRQIENSLEYRNNPIHAKDATDATDATDAADE
jgi:hypothetical protein